MWRYRAIFGRDEARKADEALDRFAASPWAPPADANARLKYFRERLARLQDALGGRDRAAALDPAALAQFQSIEAVLNRIEDPNTSPELRSQGAAAIEGDLQTMELRTTDALEKRSMQLDARARDEGPRITFVAQAGTERRLQELGTEKTALQSQGALGLTDRARLTKLDAKIKDLQAQAAQPTTRKKDRVFVFRVVADCGAIPSMAIFLAAVLAFPAAWRSRFWGILIGIPALYAVNVFRLACLGMLGAYVGEGQIFDFAHHYVWQGIYIVFVVALWLLWVEYMVMVKEKPSCPKAAQ
jgi:exosortase/archaeosortase family protein